MPPSRQGLFAISIHVPREGHDRRQDFDISAIQISIHVPREGHDANPEVCLLATKGISIHVPREGHDVFYGKIRTYLDKFQSTCPARGTTAFALDVLVDNAISIHVPREGHDSKDSRTTSPWTHFNPRAPRGARLYRITKFAQKWKEGDSI